MKRLSIIALVAFALVSALPARAQYERYGSRPPSRYGVPRGSGVSSRAGIGSSSSPFAYCGFRLGVVGGTIGSDNVYYKASSMKSGLNVGFSADVMLSTRTPLFLETGLQYTEKGGKTTLGSSHLTYNLNYLEVPLVLKYQYKIDRSIAITPFLGGYASCGVGGKLKDNTLRVAESAFSDGNFRRFDAGIRVGCGMMLDMLYFEVGYDAGLANISQDSFDTAHTGALFANVGINF